MGYLKGGTGGIVAPKAITSYEDHGGQTVAVDTYADGNSDFNVDGRNGPGGFGSSGTPSKSSTRS